jgi:hypothetical protein
MIFHPSEAATPKEVKEDSPHAADTGKTSANSLSSSYIDLMKEAASSSWSQTKTIWSDVLGGKATLGEYGEAVAEVGAGAFVGGVVALGAAPEVLAAGGYAAIGAADALSIGGLTAEIGGAIAIVGGTVTSLYDDFRKE